MIQIGRFTAQHEGPLVVFLIGVRNNNWWRFREWLPVVQAMNPMIQYLYQHPQSGFLGLGGQWLSMDLRGLLMVQYWRSSDDLYQICSGVTQKRYTSPSDAPPGAAREGRV